MKPAAVGRADERGVAAWLRRLKRKLSASWARTKAPGRFLCDSCRYDYSNACRQPGRPNATHCPDYKAR